MWVDMGGYARGIPYTQRGMLRVDVPYREWRVDVPYREWRDVAG